MKDVAIAILNWNGAELLKRFMPSVLAHTSGTKIYVIDNKSTDNSLDVLRNEFPSVSIIQNDGNLGYAGGYNKGLKGIDQEYVVLLNSDVEVSPDWIKPLVQQFQTNPKLGALQPKVKDLNKQTHFEYAGASGGFIDYLGYPFCRGRIFFDLEKDNGQYDTYRKVFWATGACLMVRKSLFEKAGGLNELLFAHMEEIDLCWRMQHLGYEIGCEPQSVVYHLGGGTLNKQSAKKTYLNFRNNLVIMFLNMPNHEAFLKIMMRLVLDGLAGIKFLLDRQPDHCLAVIKAHFSFYGLFGKLVLQKSRNPLKPLYTFTGVYKRSLVVDFFVKKLRHFSELEQRDITD